MYPLGFCVLRFRELVTSLTPISARDSEVVRFHGRFLPAFPISERDAVAIRSPNPPA